MQDHSPDVDMVHAMEETRVFRKVCDQCRARKIRCSRVQPCSNCIVAKRVCEFTGAGRRPRTPPQELTSAGQDSARIEFLESRLSTVERLLQDIHSRLIPSPSAPLSLSDPEMVPHVPKASSRISGTISPASATNTTAVPVSSDRILARQRTSASEFLENALREHSPRDISTEMQSALSNLRQIVELQNSQSNHNGLDFPLAQQIPQGGLAKMPMPPLKIVVTLWSYLQASPPTVFISLCSLVGIDDFPGLCRVVYFPSNDFSETKFTAVNLCLYYMFSERDALMSQADCKDFRSYIHMCQANAETSLSNLKVFSITTADSLVALILGTIYAIDHSRPTVAWALNCAAAQIVQSPSSQEASNAQDRANLGHARAPDIMSKALWHVYTMDRALSLRLGRAPILHDWDVVLPSETHFRDVVGFAGMPTIWFQLATLQGKIYRYLYSTSALASPSEDLIERARTLAGECRVLEAETTQKRNETMELFERVQASPILAALVESDQVMLLVTLTLVYRAIPPAEGDGGAFSQECLITARKAVQKHQQCVAMLQGKQFAKRSYAHWNLLLLPFVPFFVLFCSVIETLSESDLQLIRDFASSLQQLSDVSPTMDKLWVLCNVMSKVAVMYVEAKRLHVIEDFRPEINEFDDYLGQLGFVTSEMAGQDVQSPAQWGSQTIQYDDWFLSSRTMMDLLQQDLSDIGV
ncbi:fungal specific transcription factor domain-containing protein [Fusarium oxysporum f. sp. phaseoli]